MTRNNLNTHLQWLLSAGQPASTALVPSLQAVDISRAQEEQDPLVLIDLDLKSTSQELQALVIDNATRTTQSSQRPLTSRKTPLALEVEADMARLQSEPRLLKNSQLPPRGSPLNQQLPTPTLSTPCGKKLERRIGAAGESPSKGISSIAESSQEMPLSQTSPKRNQKVSDKGRKKSKETRLKSVMTPVSRAERVDIFDEETEAKEQDAFVPAKLPRGRKRKSSELDPDSILKRADCSSKLKLRELHSPFIAIDDYLEDDPPPYSTNPAPSRRSPIRCTKVARSQIMGNVFKASSAGSISPTSRHQTAPKKTLELANLVSQYRSGGKATSSIERLEDPGSMKTFSIADSEEDDDEEQLVSRQSAPHGQADNVGRAYSQENSTGGGVSYPKLPKSTAGLSRPSNIESPCADPCRSPRRTAAVSEVAKACYQPSASVASPFHRDSPTKSSIEKRLDSMSSLAPRSFSQQERQDKLRPFLDGTPRDFQSMLEYLSGERRSFAEAHLEMMVAEDDAPGHSMERVLILNAAIDGLEAIMPLCYDYQRTGLQLRDLKQQGVAAIEGNMFHRHADTVAQIRKASTSLQQLKDEILRISEAGNLFLYLKDIVNSSADVVAVPDNPQTSRVMESQAPFPSLQLNKGSFTSAPENDLSTLSSSQPPQYVHRSSQTPRRDVMSTGTPCLAPLQSQRRKNVQDCTQRPPPKEVRSHCQDTPITKHSAKTIVTANDRQNQSFDAFERVPSRDQDLRNKKNDYDDGVTYNMGFRESTPHEISENDEFPFGEEDDGLFEACEELDKPPTTTRSPSPFLHKQVLTETPGNSMKLPKKNTTPKPPMNQTHSSQMHYHWSRDVKTAMKDRFHLKGFRLNQLEAINATLGGKDAFVLMPTGGGKSLCYQLPSIIQSGNTKGVTVVISPLLSLMHDQVDHLRKLKIQALMINGESANEHRQLVMDSLNERQVEKFIQLLYITPEMINKSQKVLDSLRALHRRGKFARLVIDEAHCVSQWGHDFRPDYKLLGEVRQQFQGVPVMALTATATENVKFDTIQNLGITGCAVFTQSFNRPNLTYEIREKSRGVLENIAELIRTRYCHQSGIIYCLSRQNCENVAQKLRAKHGIKAQHYHAGMTPEEKMEVQRDWQAGDYHVIVATIAFGMGIDKPDVRFVIHHTIPKSLEGYYQETGRAGRDTKRSGCYLYYGYSDTSALKRMIDTGDGSYEQKERQRNMLRFMVQFCENRSDCRRVQVLRYFNEVFRSEDCHGACDNCLSNDTFEEQDLTQHAVTALKLVKEVQENKLTLINCVDILWGGKGQRTTKYNKMPQYKTASELTRGDVERIFYRLLGEDALKQESVMNNSGFPVQYIGLGRKCGDYLGKSRRLLLQVRTSAVMSRAENTKRATSKAKAKVKPATGVAASHERVYPPSTNVSSPVQAGNRSKRRRIVEEDDSEDLDGFVVDDDDEEEYLDSQSIDGGGDENGGEAAFEPIRVAGKQRQSRRRQLGPPIQCDDRLQGLSEIHQHVIVEFLIHAKRTRQDLMVKHSLRDQPFTDNALREMAIQFPRDKSDMLKLRGVDPDRVDRFAKAFLPLIKSTQEQYSDMIRDSEIPQDPNHRNVIELSDSDDEDQYEDQDIDEWVENDVGPTGQSPFFQPEPDVEAFNARVSEVAATAPAPSRPPAEGNDSRWKNSGRGSFSGYKKFHKASSKRKVSGGVAKKGRANEKRTSFENGGGKRKSYNNGFGGGGGGGGIGMMPT